MTIIAVAIVIRSIDNYMGSKTEKKVKNDNFCKVGSAINIWQRIGKLNNLIVNQKLFLIFRAAIIFSPTLDTQRRNAKL